MRIKREIERLSKKYITKKLIPYLLVLFVVTLSIAYSAFGTNLNIGSFLADIRLEEDIRITGIRSVSSSEVEKTCSIEKQDETKYSIGDVVTCTVDGIENKFYVIEEAGLDSSTVQMLTEKNINTTTYRQSDDAGTVAFGTDENMYWTDENGNLLSQYPLISIGSGTYANIYDKNNETIKPIIDNYVGYLNVKLTNATGSLLTLDQILDLGCTWDGDVSGNCNASPSWISSTTYWLGSTHGGGIRVLDVTNGSIFHSDYVESTDNGVRPVITISTSEFGSNYESNGGLSTYEDYNKTSISAGVKLPNVDSIVTYAVEITNIEAVEMGILDIIGLPDNLDYEILNYDLTDKICDNTGKCNLGISKEIYIQIKYKDSNETVSETPYDITLNFEFQPFYTVTYTDMANNGYPTEIMGGDTLRVDFGEKALPYIMVKSNGVEIGGYTYTNGVLTLPNVSGNIEISDSIATFTGTYITFNNRSIINYKIYGNSIQNGTPTIDTPVEVESIGVKTNNLFNQGITEVGTLTGRTPANARDFQEGVWYIGLTPNNYYDPNHTLSYSFEKQVTKVTVDGQMVYGIAQAFKTEPNQTYTISYEETNQIAIGFFDAEGNYIKYITVYSGGVITIPENCYWMTICLYSQVGSEEATYSNIQLVLGDQIQDYEPYGYKLPVQVGGSNLVNLEDTNITFSNSYYINQFPNDPKVLLEPNTKYTLSFDYNIISADGIVQCNIGYGDTIYKADIKGFTYPSQSGKGHFSQTITTPSDFGNIETPYLALRLARLSTKGDLNVNISNIQFEKSEVETDYEPYKEPTITNIFLDEPLRKVGKDADYIDYENKQIVRYFAKKIIDGTENWGKTEISDTKVCANFTLENGVQYWTTQSSNTEVISNLLPLNYAASTRASTNQNEAYSLAATTGKFYVGILSSRLISNDIEGLKAYFVDLYSKGTPMYIIYKRADVYTETIELPEIITNNGTTTLTAAGANMEITVKSIFN